MTRAWQEPKLGGVSVDTAGFLCYSETQKRHSVPYINTPSRRPPSTGETCSTLAWPVCSRTATGSVWYHTLMDLNLLSRPGSKSEKVALGSGCKCPSPCRRLDPLAHMNWAMPQYQLWRLPRTRRLKLQQTKRIREFSRGAKFCMALFQGVRNFDPIGYTGHH
jgi:hypothetical protein